MISSGIFESFNQIYSFTLFTSVWFQWLTITIFFASLVNVFIFEQNGICLELLLSFCKESIVLVFYWLKNSWSTKGQIASLLIADVLKSTSQDTDGEPSLIKVTCSIERRRQWHPTPVLLAGKSHGQRSLVGCSPWGREESDTTEWLHFHFSLSCIVEGNGNPLQYSCLENPRDGRAWWAAVYGVTQSWTRLKRLSSSSSSSIEILENFILNLTSCRLTLLLILPRLTFFF